MKRSIIPATDESFAYLEVEKHREAQSRPLPKRGAIRIPINKSAMSGMAVQIDDPSNLPASVQAKLEQGNILRYK